MTIAGYKVRINGGGLVNQVTDVGNVLAHTFTGLDPDTEYSVEVEAYDADGLESGYSSAVLATTDPVPDPPLNVALASLGSSATALSSAGAGFGPSALIDGRRDTNNNYESGTVWISNADPATTPQWVEIDFGVSRSISEIDVFSLEDAVNYTIQPYLKQIATNNALTAFLVQYWNGSSWVTVGTATSNPDVWARFLFSPVTTQKIRLYVTGSILAQARCVEVEAWAAGRNPRVVVLEGDSRATWAYQLQRQLDHDWAVMAISTGGESVQDMVTGGQVASQAVPLHNAQAVDNILIQAGGINDFHATYSLASIKANYQTYCEQARAAGFKVICCTVILATSSFVGGANEANRVAFNTWLLANYATFADAVCDFASDPAFDDPTDATYFVADHIHFTPASELVMAALMEPVIRSLV